MSDILSVAKLCCGSNDFIISDLRESNLPQNVNELVARLCNRRESVGADGVIFLLDDEKYPFRISLFNSDGSPAEVSYNGSRCVGYYAWANGLTQDCFSFGSVAGEISVSLENNIVTISVPSPVDWQLDMELKLAEAGHKASFIVAGVPYLIFFVDNLETEWVETVPRQFKTHEQFPLGTNVAIVQLQEGGKPKARFFERGVDEETPSSGSGCVAVAALCNLQFGLESPVTVATAAGDFAISFERDATGFQEILTSGRVIYCFDGKVKY